MHPQTVVSRHRRSAVTSVLASNRLKRDPHVRLSVRRESSLRRELVILQQTQQQQVQAFVFVPRVSWLGGGLGAAVVSAVLGDGWWIEAWHFDSMTTLG